MEKDLLNEDCNQEEGIITKISNGIITIHIQQKDSCSTCAIKGACEKTSTRGKDIEVTDKNPENYSVGEKVNVNVPQSKGLKAARIAFVYPLLLIIASGLVTYNVFHLKDALIALIALGFVAIYYFVLYLLRNKPIFNFNISISKII
jgi:positive regulator of sigma E activity